MNPDKRTQAWRIIDALDRMDYRKPILLFGPPGTGKTRVAERLASRGAALPPLRHPCARTDLPDTYLGSWALHEGTWKWQDGLGSLALRHGRAWVADECDAAFASEAAPVLHGLCDPDSPQTLTPCGERILAAPGYRVVGTSNVTPDQLPEALRDRFGVRVFVPAPSDAAIAALPEDLRDGCLTAYAAAADGAPLIASYRDCQRFGELREGMAVDDAATAVWLENGPAVMRALLIGPRR